MADKNPHNTDDDHNYTEIVLQSFPGQFQTTDETGETNSVIEKTDGAGDQTNAEENNRIPANDVQSPPDVTVTADGNSEIEKEGQACLNADNENRHDSKRIPAKNVQPPPDVTVAENGNSEIEKEGETYLNENTENKDEIKRPAGQIQTLKQRLPESQDEGNSLKEENVTYEQSVKEENEITYPDHTAEKNRLAAQIQTLSHQLPESRDEHGRLKEENATYEQRLADKIQTLNQQLIASHDEVAMLKKENDIQEQRLAAQNRTLNQQLHESLDEVARLKEEKCIYEQRLAAQSKTLNQQLSASDDEVSRLKEEKDINERRLAAQIKTLNQQLRESQDEVARLKEEKDTKQQRFAAQNQTLNQQLGASRDEVRNLSSRLKEEKDIYKQSLENNKKAFLQQNKRQAEVVQNLAEDITKQKLTSSKRIKQLEKDIASLEEKAKAKKMEQLNKDEQHKEEIQRLQTAVHIAETEKLDLERVFQQHQREILFQQNEMKEKSKNIENLQHEKRELINKLKEMSGSRSLPMEVKCVLSDENRPTRLAEDYRILYNNEWKDMFVTLSFSEEQCKADYILKLLKNADQLSRMSSERHRSSIKRSFTTITVGGTPDLQKDTDDAVPGRRLNVTARRRKSTADKSNSQADTVCYREILFDFEKLATEHKCTVNAVRAVVMAEVAEDFEKAALDIISETLTGDLKKNESVKRFMSKSVSLCWRMCRHDPPVHINFQDITDRNIFDRNVYKPYKTSGERVLFIVWPALYAHEGGPLLEKGIAEGRP